MQLPAPRETLADCVWLPRILAKARLAAEDALPAIYRCAYCHTLGVDGHFLSHFDLNRETIEEVCRKSESAIASWFTTLPSVSDFRVREWNELAVNLGKDGYPMADIFPIALKRFYGELAGLQPRTVFEALELDEGFRTTPESCN